MKSDSSVLGKVCSYLASAGDAQLPAEVQTKAKHLILDTLAAIISGSKLKPGKLIIKFIESQGGAKEAQVLASPIVTSAINAALANGVMAHADETDDSHTRSRTHPGCAIIPPALAVAEKEQADGMRLLKAVVAGYDIACRIAPALGLNIGVPYTKSRSSHSIGGNFGAVAAAAVAAGLDENAIRCAISYTAQQASGITTWVRDEEHVEKAFVFAGMPSRNGVTSVIMAQSGFSSTYDDFTGSPNFFEAFGINPKPELFAAGLGELYEIMYTNVKKYSVGAPIQAALDALFSIMNEHGVTPANVESLKALLPTDGARVVDDREMPDINLQYNLAVALLDKAVTFESSHSFERMNDPAVLALRKRITLVEDPGLSAAKVAFQAIVEVNTKDGATFRKHVETPRGKAENPMTTEEVVQKCKELIVPVLGKDRSQKLINEILNIEKLSNVRSLRPLLSAAAQSNKSDETR